MLLCPPQHGKSSVTSRRYPAYILGHDPTIDIISASATSDLAEGFGRDVRNCVSSLEYRNLFPDTVLSEDSQAKGRWNTSQGGSYYAVGIGGQLFGRGGMAIIDDPFGTWEEAQSENAREKVWDWYQGTLYNRIRPGQPIIVIQHRMHEDDLVGRLLEAEKQGGDKWEVINLPAHLDDPPWPERYDRKALERIKANTKPQQWSALYLQNPTPDVGIYFKREWFKRYVVGEAPKGMYYYATSDHAPEGTQDSNVLRIWGVCSLNNIYLCDGFNKQCKMDEFTDLAMPVLKRWKPLCWFPENDNNWKSISGFVLKAMRKANVACRIEPISPMGGDKIIKAQAIQGLASSGAVYIPYGRDSGEMDYGDVIEQYVKFPGGRHDDDVDAGANLGRAIIEVHPGFLPNDQPPPPKDKWDRVFAEDEEEVNWRTQ